MAIFMWVILVSRALVFWTFWTLLRFAQSSSTSLSRRDVRKRRKRMPKRDELYAELRLKGPSSLRVEGLPAVLRSNLITQEELASGDRITLFSLPDGKYFASKADPEDGDAYTIGKVTLAHIYFDDEMTVKEI